MGPVDPASLALRDIHLPDGIAWWPPAAGWWGLLLVFAVMAIFTLLWRRNRIRMRLHSRVLAELASIRAGLHRDLTPQQLLETLSALLRRVAISCTDRADVASLHGAAWRKYLAAETGDATVEGTPGQLLTVGVYRRGSDFDAEALIDTVQTWVEKMAMPRP